jgi:Holliday junction resolvase
MKKGYETEHERAKQLEALNYFVIRASSSIGTCGEDLIAVRKNDDGTTDVRIEQVKSLKGSTFYFDEMSRSELIKLKNLKSTKNLPCYFVIKFKRQGWLEFDVTNLEAKPIKFLKGG